MTLTTVEPTYQTSNNVDSLPLQSSSRPNENRLFLVQERLKCQCVTVVVHVLDPSIYVEVLETLFHNPLKAKVTPIACAIFFSTKCLPSTQHSFSLLVYSTLKSHLLFLTDGRL
ncbi:hypothetical protein GOODEAATRI_012262 [Goodea atripinnis]|uniref:Uncharacterized protein n=1 Tax=Goodea atripinnis TaxID=208336 RepID=A0ABV0NTY2_9TELE